MKFCCVPAEEIMEGDSPKTKKPAPTHPKYSIMVEAAVANLKVR